MDWRPDHLKAKAKPPLFENEIDILQRALDVYRFEYEGHDVLMDRQDWTPVQDLMRKLEQRFKISCENSNN
jgi:hypothetical protein